MPRDGSLPPGCKNLIDTLEHVRVIGNDGKQLGLLTIVEAMRIADSEGAELIQDYADSDSPNLSNYRVASLSGDSDPAEDEAKEAQNY